jgi:hypothetical protein
LQPFFTGEPSGEDVYLLAINDNALSESFEDIVCFRVEACDPNNAGSDAVIPPEGA